MKLCLATTTHNFMWVKITHICLISNQTNICKSRCLNTNFIPNNSDFIGQQDEFKPTIVVILVGFNSSCFAHLPLQRGDRLYSTESDVCRRQIVTYKDDPRTERVNIIFLMASDP